VRRHHHLPFGAECRPEGGVRFRLWAPAAHRVELVPGSGAAVPLEPGAGGFFETTLAEAEAGLLYRYRIDGELEVPDPASRFQPEGAEGPSEVIDPRDFAWPDEGWPGRPWHEAVLYELHVGALTSEGSYAGVSARLDQLAELGVTALELMPLSECPGERNWGYDGVLPFAPTRRHGRPEDLKRLVGEAHARGLMVLLDVVYNHFGPQGNHLHRYAPDFFTDRHHTPWGAAIDLDGPRSGPVREFFVRNALYWLEEYHLDGLRLDAVHSLFDESRPDFLEELADAVRAGPGGARHVHLVLENDRNDAHRLERDDEGRPRWYTAQWNDDWHHAAHVLATGETDGYYGDYARAPASHLGRCLAEGFAYQGEPSAHRGGRPRGEASASLPPPAFVDFLQNHDQVGNRALGERLDALAPPEAVAALTAVLLLSPQVPLLFMGQEWAAPEPFPFFCDFRGRLAAKVREGRRREFASFARFRDADALEHIPDPGAAATFESAVLRWERRDEGLHGERLAWVRRLLALRHREVVPRLPGARSAGYHVHDGTGLTASWVLADGAELALVARLGPHRLAPAPPVPPGRLLVATDAALPEQLGDGVLEPWSAAWFLEGAADGSVA